jgi:hypothetical protein
MAYPSLIAQGLNPLVDLSCRAQYRQLCFWRSAALSLFPFPLSPSLY